MSRRDPGELYGHAIVRPVARVRVTCDGPPWRDWSGVWEFLCLWLALLALSYL